jgi:hypothetical protein
VEDWVWAVKVGEQFYIQVTRKIAVSRRMEEKSGVGKIIISMIDFGSVRFKRQHDTEMRD